MGHHTVPMGVCGGESSPRKAPLRRRWRLGIMPRSEGPAPAGSRWLLSPPFAAHAAELLSARELAALAQGSRGHQDATATMVRAAMERRHGLRIAQGTAADLHAFDGLPDELAVSLRKPGGTRRVVEAGSPLGVCCVGGHRRKLTLAQMPPARGDRWRMELMLKRGCYVLCVEGWELSAGRKPLGLVIANA